MSDLSEIWKRQAEVENKRHQKFLMFLCDIAENPDNEETIEIITDFNPDEYCSKSWITFSRHRGFEVIE